VLPPELNQGVLFNFNGYQSVGEYGLFLDELLEGVKRELVESGGRGSLGVMLELADLDCFLKHHGKGAMHELLFKGSWKIVEREPEVLDDVRRKAGLFFEVQAAAFQRWQAMRQGARELLATHREGLAKRGPLDLDRAGMAVAGEWKGTVTDAVELALGLEASGLMLFPAEMTQQERIIEIAGKWGGFCAAFRPNPQPAHEPESRASQGNRAHEGGGHRPTGGTGQALKIYGVMITQ
jgi:hypothetical protein